MKKVNFIYILSIIVILATIYIIIVYQHSNRMALIAGVLSIIGLGLNTAAYLFKK
jgi:hypothetical protein